MRWVYGVGLAPTYSRRTLQKLGTSYRRDEVSEREQKGTGALAPVSLLLHFARDLGDPRQQSNQ